MPGARTAIPPCTNFRDLRAPMNPQNLNKHIAEPPKEWSKSDQSTIQFHIIR